MMRIAARPDVLSTNGGASAPSAYHAPRVVRRIVGLAVLLLIPMLGFGSAFASAARPAAKSGGTLNIVGVGQTWASTDPIYKSAIQSAAEPYNLTYQTLFNYNTTTGKIDPLLALSFAYNASHSTLTIQLRHNVLFQDGTPFNAQAAVFNLDRTSAASSGSPCVPFFTNVTSIQAVGTYEVKISFNPLYSALPDVLASNPCTYMASPTAVSSEGANFPFQPVGTSSYKFVSENLGISMTYTRFTKAWEKAHVNTVVFTNLGDDNSAIEAVQANTAQVYDTSGPQDIALAKAAGLKVASSPPTSEGYVRLNMTAPPFNNVVAREAFAAAINGPLIVKTLFGKAAIPDQSMLTPTSWAFAGEKVHGFPQYNPSRAAALVASLPGGKLSFTLIGGNTPIQQQFIAALGSELTAIPGISMSLSPQTSTVLLSDQHNLTYQALYALGNGSLPDPDNNYYRALYSTSTNNQEGYVNSTFDNLIIEARETFSQAQRKSLYLKAELLLATGLPIIPVYAYPISWIYNKHVHNFPALDTGNGELSGVTVT